MGDPTGEAEEAPIRPRGILCPSLQSTGYILSILQQGMRKQPFLKYVAYDGKKSAFGFFIRKIGFRIFYSISP